MEGHRAGGSRRALVVGVVDVGMVLLPRGWGFIRGVVYLTEC